MNDLVGFVVVLGLIATLGFFAAFLFWIFVALMFLSGVFFLWAALTEPKSGERDTRNPAREDRAA